MSGKECSLLSRTHLSQRIVWKYSNIYNETQKQSRCSTLISLIALLYLFVSLLVRTSLRMLTPADCQFCYYTWVINNYFGLYLKITIWKTMYKVGIQQDLSIIVFHIFKIKFFFISGRIAIFWTAAFGSVRKAKLVGVY